MELQNNNKKCDSISTSKSKLRKHKKAPPPTIFNSVERKIYDPTYGNNYRTPFHRSDTISIYLSVIILYTKTENRVKCARWRQIFRPPRGGRTQKAHFRREVQNYFRVRWWRWGYCCSEEQEVRLGACRGIGRWVWVVGEGATGSLVFYVYLADGRETMTDGQWADDSFPFSCPAG